MNKAKHENLRSTDWKDLAFRVNDSSIDTAKDFTHSNVHHNNIQKPDSCREMSLQEYDLEGN
jgi:hypothetical protein